MRFGWLRLGQSPSADADYTAIHELFDPLGLEKLDHRPAGGHLAHYFAPTILFFCAPSFVIPISTTSPGSR